MSGEVSLLPGKGTKDALKAWGGGFCLGASATRVPVFFPTADTDV